APAAPLYCRAPLRPRRRPAPSPAHRPHRRRVSMHAYVLASDRRIAPFGDPPGEALIANRTLAEHQDRAFAALGLVPRLIASPAEIHPAERDALLVRDHVFFSRGVPARFLDATRDARETRVLALPRGPLVEFTRGIQDLVFEPDFAHASGERAV